MSNCDYENDVDIGQMWMRILWLPFINEESCDVIGKDWMLYNAYSNECWQK